MKQTIFISNENTAALAIEDSGFLFQEPNSMNDELSNIDVINYGVHCVRRIRE